MLQPHIIIPTATVIIILTAAFVILQFIRSRRKERSEMIEKGINPMMDIDIDSFNKMSNLRNGILFLSIGLGLLCGQWVKLTWVDLDGFITYLTSTLIFGGLGFLITYRLIKQS